MRFRLGHIRKRWCRTPAAGVSVLPNPTILLDVKSWSDHGCVGTCHFDNHYLKDFSSLLSLDLFLLSSLDFVKNPQWIQISGTVQNLKRVLRLQRGIFANWTLIEENIVNFSDSLKIIKMNQLSFFIDAQQVFTSTQMRPGGHLSSVRIVAKNILVTYHVQ